jgi:membrane-bound serine protease (ClpP class)
MNARGNWPKRKYRIAIGLFVALFALCSLTFSKATRAADNPAGPLVLELKLDGEIEPVLANYVDGGITDAARRHVALVLITMDTPGGLSDSMTEIIHHILDSPVPVVVYVSPDGARGASAGFLILLSADVAAMAPGTRTGAATPVLMPGWASMPMDEVLRRKINNDATAFLRSVTDKRGRDTKLAETAITDARAFTAQEALSGHLIDMVVDDQAELLRQLNGREITRFNGKKETLSLQNYQVQEFQLSARERFLARIADPNIFFLLLIIGALGLYTEFTHPGVVAPGVVGGICILLALYAMQILPINIAGVLLIFLGLALFILEAKFTSHGVLLLGGIVSMLLGAMFLVRSPLTPAGVSFGVALAAVVPFAFLSVFLMRLVLKSRRWKTATGKEELVGEEGVVTIAVPGGGEGMIRVHGELWRAGAKGDVPVGAKVRVLRIDGLKLVVEPLAIGASIEK